MNKKFLIAILVTLSLVGIFIVLPVSAEEPTGAKVIKLPWARLPKEDSGLGDDLWTTDEAWQVETPSGQVVLIAHFDIPEEFIPNKTMKNTGFLVTTWAAGDSYDTMCIATSGGRAMLRAIINPHKE